MTSWLSKLKAACEGMTPYTDGTYPLANYRMELIAVVEAAYNLRAHDDECARQGYRPFKCDCSRKLLDDALAALKSKLEAGI